MLLTLVTVLTPLSLLTPEAKAAVTWSSRALGTGEPIVDIAYGDNCFIAVSGETGGIYKSTDGGTTFVQKDSLNTSVSDIAYGNGIFVITVKASANVYYSIDSGDTWHMSTMGSGMSGMAGIAYGTGGFVAIGTDGTSSEIYQSANGIAWAATSVTALGSGNGLLLQRPQFGGGTYVAVGTAGKALSSSDGITWAPATCDAGANMTGAAFGGGFVAVCSDGSTRSSSNGTAWTIGGSAGVPLNDVVFGGGLYYAVGAGGSVFSSVDGTSWASESSGVGGTLYGVCYGSSAVVACGASGTLVVGAEPPQAPVVTSVTPNVGSIAGGATVTITGTGFADATAVNFGTTAATSFTGNATSITAVAPAGTVGTVDITVTTELGTSSTGVSDKYTYVAAPTITNLSVTSGPLGGGNSVIITGTGFTGASVVSFGLSAALGFTINSDTSITATAPAGSFGTIDVAITGPGGTTTAAAPDQYTYLNPPVITAITPTTGPTAGGTVLTISGTDLLNASVLFGSTSATPSATTATSITVTAPAGTAGTVHVRAVTSGGTSAAVVADQYTYASVPTVTSLSVTSGPASGGTTLTITGTNLSGVTGVTFGATAATFTPVSATAITATAPAGAAGIVDVKVTTPGGTSAVVAGDKFTYNIVPIVTSMSTSAGPIGGGNTLVITGSNFTGATLTIAGTAVVSYTVDSNTQITATVPAHAAGGPYDVLVTNANGTSAVVTADKYTYVAAPTISTISTIKGSVLGGTQVTITGSNLSTVTAVTFGSSYASVYAQSATSISFYAPAGTGYVTISLSNPGGTTAYGTQFQYGSVPTITSMSTTGGLTSTATNVTITGTGFTGVSLVTGVKFGAVAGTNITVISDTSITVKSPSTVSTVSTVDVYITNPYGTNAACTADKYTYNTGAATISSYTPTSGPTQGGGTITITGTKLLGVTAVKFGSTSAAFTVVSDTSVTATVPAGSSGSVAVSVTTSFGTANAATSYTYALTAPTVTAVSPSSGPLTGGTTLTLTGTNFLGTTAVQFGSTSASFAIVSNTQITATIPTAATASTVDITVTTPGGTSATSANAQYAYKDVPVVTGLSLVGGTISGGTTVTITGYNFTGLQAVKFGSYYASVISSTATSVTVRTPAVAATTVDVTVRTTVGTSAIGTAAKYIYYTTPTVSTVLPNTGVAGTIVTITGSYFTSVSAVKFGTTSATFTVVNASTITATVPTGGNTQTIYVTNGLGANSSGATFTYPTTPTITTVSPAAGNLTGGGTVTITGTNFTGATSVVFGSTAATIVSVSATTIVAQAPAGSAGAVGVKVATPFTSITAANAYTYCAAPTLTAISASTGPSSGGATLTLTGTNFSTSGTTASKATAVLFGTTAATPYTVNSATSITVTVPAGVSGTIDITIVTPGGTTATSTADRYNYIGPPTISGLAAAIGPLAGGNTVVITGTNFTTVTAVSFGSSPAASYTVDSATKITAVAPSGTAGTVYVSVCALGGITANIAADLYTYANAPVITSVAPNWGPAAGGSQVVILGTDLTGTTAVTFGGNNATVVSCTATRLTVTAPAGAVGQTDIRVTAGGGQSAIVSADQFTYMTAPVVTAISPTSGPTAGGTAVTLTGTNLTGATSVQFGAAAGVIVSNTSTTIVVKAPAAAGATVDVTVTTAGGGTSETTAADQFTFIPPPAITTVTPAGGPLSGGNTVVITGSSFIGVTGVKFGTTAAAYTVDSPTQLTATVPSGAAGAVDIFITSPSGTNSPSAADLYVYTTSPTVASVTPSAGPLTAGSTLVVCGSNFSGATSVKIGTVAAAFTVTNDGQMTVTAPAGTAGTEHITVTNAAGTNTPSATDQYTYVAPPALATLSSNFGPATGGINLTLTGTNFSNVLAVNFGTTAASFTVDSASQLTVTTPAHSVGIVDITIVTAGGTTATGATSKYTYAVIPAISGLSVSKGPLSGGGTVVISGTDLTGATSVKFGTTTASFTVNSGTKITATVPSGTAGAADIFVTTGAGTSVPSGPGRYTYLDVPLVSGTTPGNGPLSGGGTVVLTGSHLADTSAVQFGGTTAAFIVNSDSKLTATAPAGTAGSVTITVTTPGGTSTAGAGNHYVYYAAPTVSSVAPCGGSVSGGETVTITGTNLTDATTVSFGGIAGVIISNYDTQITARTPAHSAGIVDVTVTTPGGTSLTAAADMYSYVSIPVVTGLSASLGSTAGGATIVISGSGFSGVTSVLFGTTRAAYIINSAASIQAIVPSAITPGTVDVTVQTTGGTSDCSALDHYTYALAPTVTTDLAQSIGTAECTLGGIVLDDGGIAVTERGVVLSTEHTPSIYDVADRKLASTAGGIGPFSDLVGSLLPGTVYYFRAYALNTIGVDYGTELTFTTEGIGLQLVPSQPLSEVTIDGSSLELTLNNTTFKAPPLLSDITLNNAPTGLTIDSVTTTDATHCTVGLRYTGSTMTADVTNLSVTLSAAVIPAGVSITSNTISIEAKLNLPTLLFAYRVSDTLVDVKLSKPCSQLDQTGGGGFTVTKTGTPSATYTVTATAQGSDATHVLLHVDSIATASGAGVTVTYTAGGAGLIEDLSGRAMCSDSTGVPVPLWSGASGSGSSTSGTSTAGGGGIAGGSGGGGSTTASDSGSASSKDGIVLLDGSKGDFGAVARTSADPSNPITTVTFEKEKLHDALNTSAANPVLTVKAPAATQILDTVFTRQTLQSLSKSGATIVLETPMATYTQPVSKIDADAILSQLDAKSPSDNIAVHFTVSQRTGEDAEAIEASIAKRGCTLVSPIVEFSISCTINDTLTKLDTFNSFIKRTIILPDDVDPAKCTTAVVIKPDGAVYHVPTKILTENGHHIAQISSLTNSTYAVVSSTQTFSDISYCWAQDSINDMGTRLIVTGTDSTHFSPDQYISRAEFSAIIVRALGLDASTDASGFKDVPQDAWYSGYVKTASNYSLATGTEDKNFNPGDNLTREQAMTMIARAMKLSGLDTTVSPKDTATLLGGFKDGSSTSAFAENSVAQCLSAGIVSGRSNTSISPKETITRAEIAVIVERLLTKSGLI